MQLITKKLELPVKLVFPRNLVGGQVIKDWWWRIHDAGTRDMVCHILKALDTTVIEFGKNLI